MKRKKHPPGIPGCPKNRTELKKGWLAGIVVVIALLFVEYNLYRYPAMFRSLSDHTYIHTGSCAIRTIKAY